MSSSQMKNLIRAAVRHYTGWSVALVEVQEDPRVQFTYAIRAWEPKARRPIFFLLVNGRPSESVEDLSDMLEEVEFKSPDTVFGRFLVKS